VPEGAKPEDFPYDPSTIQKWSMVHEPDQVSEYLMQQNKIHFGQAHGSPFTVQPLDKLDWAASTPESEAIIQHQNRKQSLMASYPLPSNMKTHT
jgi:hypothetical protein